MEIILPRHGVNNEIWLVEEVEIEELESQLLQWRLTMLQRDHESLYAQSVKARRIQPIRARELSERCRVFAACSPTPRASDRKAICLARSSAARMRSGSRRICGPTFPVARSRSSTALFSGPAQSNGS